MWSSCSSSAASSLLKGATQTPSWMARRILASMNQQTSSRCSLSHHHHSHYHNHNSNNKKPQIILALDIQRDSIDMARISIHGHHNTHHNDTTVHHQSLDPLMISSRRLALHILEELSRQITSCQGVLVHWPLQQPYGRAGGPCGRVWYTLETLVDFSFQQEQHENNSEPTPLFSHHHRPLCLWTPTTTNSTTETAIEDEWGRCALYGRTTPPPHHPTHNTLYKASVEHYVWPTPPDATQLWHDFCQAQALPFELLMSRGKQQDERSRTTQTNDHDATSRIPPTTPLSRRSCNTLIDWRHAPATAAAAHLEQSQEQQSWAAVV